jgi:hypothetical protein
MSRWYGRSPPSRCRAADNSRRQGAEPLGEVGPPIREPQRYLVDATSISDLPSLYSLIQCTSENSTELH